METITDRTEWDQALQQFRSINDVYFDYDYFDIYKRNFNVEPEAILWEDQHISIFWSHLIREIPNKLICDQRLFDLITPYGYGGPLINCKVDNKSKVQKSLSSFMKEYIEFAKEKKYICEFIRFHPIVRNWELFTDGFRDVITLEYVNNTVYIDLSYDLDHIWQGIRKGHKYNIKKTEREGCEIQTLLCPSESDILEFSSLYYSTMEKCQASKKYFFDASFIKDHFSQLSSALMRINYCGQLISASMFITGESCIHYHLSGSCNVFRGVYASELIIWNAIKWAKENNFKYFHLGGGLGKEDSLFYFKKGFSKTTAPFYTGKIIFDYEQYKTLENLHQSPNVSENFFPAYRDEQSNTII